MPLVPTPSSVIVSDPSTLVKNFTENAGKVYCQAASDAGKLAILGLVTGVGSVLPEAIFGLGALGVLGAATCQNSIDPEKIAGSLPIYGRAQCSVPYRVYYVSRRKPPETGQASYHFDLNGPILSMSTRTVGNPGENTFDVVHWRAGNPPVEGDVTLANPSNYWVNEIYYVGRVDGSSEECGQLPREGGQIITNVNEGDRTDITNIVDNSQKIYVAPITFDFGGKQFTVNMPFSNIRVDSLLPLNFQIEIGGNNFGFGQDPNNPSDPTLKPKPVPPVVPKDDNKQPSLDDLMKVLNKIRECVCKKDIELDMLFLPYVDAKTSCDIETANFLVPKGSVSNQLVSLFENTATAAANKCADKEPEQMPEKLIFAASTTTEGKELFTQVFNKEVRSLRLKITDIRDGAPNKITLYPAANQRKFGSVSFVTETISGGGDYIYVFDTDTYIPLPARGKKGKLRILLKPSLSFEVYDTGERY